MGYFGLPSVGMYLYHFLLQVEVSVIFKQI